MNRTLLPQQVNHLLNLTDRIILGSCCSRYDLFHLRIEWDSFIQMFGTILKKSKDFQKVLDAINKIIYDPLPPLNRKRSLWSTMFEDATDEEQRYIKNRIILFRDELMSLRILCANNSDKRPETAIRFYFRKT